MFIYVKSSTPKFHYDVKPDSCQPTRGWHRRTRVMEGIIGRRVLSDMLIHFLRNFRIGEDPYLFHAHDIKVRLLLYHLVPVDFDVSQYIDEKKS